MEYISNQLLDHAQILNLSFRWLRNILQILKIKTTSIGRQPRIIKKKESLTNHLLGHTLILNLNLDDQTSKYWK